MLQCIGGTGSFNGGSVMTMSISMPGRLRLRILSNGSSSEDWDAVSHLYLKYVVHPLENVRIHSTLGCCPCSHAEAISSELFLASVKEYRRRKCGRLDEGVCTTTISSKPARRECIISFEIATKVLSTETLSLILFSYSPVDSSYSR